MKRIDSVIMKEILGPWGFGVAMFSVVIFAGNFLFQLSNFIVQGAGMFRVAELTLLFLPSVIIKTFPMAILLAALLSFGRLSSDSEIVAMRAAGVSILRMMYPVALFSFAIAVLSFGLNELIVPPATMQALALQDKISTELKSNGDQPLAASQKDDKGNQIALIAATDFDLNSRSLEKVTITSYDKSGKPSFYLYTPLLRYTDNQNWRIIGGGTLVAADGSYSMTLKGDTWPPEVQSVKLTPADILRQSLKTLDAFSLSQMRQQIQEAKNDPHVSRKQVANLEYGFWNKFALPLAALVYGLLGAPLGIRNVRTGAATGFAVSVAIIFAYITLANLMNVYAMGGAIPAYLASFTPLVIGLIAAGVIIWRRNG
jgi:lipopolysaccharide export system permease protein